MRSINRCNFKRKTLAFLALSSCSVEAFTSLTIANSRIIRSPIGKPVHRIGNPRDKLCTSPCRLFHSSNKNDSKDEGLLSKAVNAVKSALPANLFRSEKEKSEIQRRRDVRENFSSSIDEALKGAPLGFRMMGKLMGPLMSAAASSMAEAFAEQQQESISILEDANSILRKDPTVASLLGMGLEIGSPFSQSSSSTIVNGAKQSKLEMTIPVIGDKGSGVARLFATQDGISRLQIEANGQLVEIPVLLRAESARKRKYGGIDEDVIEAEIVEKRSRIK